MFDPIAPPGLQWYWKAGGAIARHITHGTALPTELSQMHPYPIDDAAARVPQGAMAWSYRDAKWAAVILGVCADPADKGKITAWARAYWEALHPYSAGGAYVNFMMEEGDERIRATYRDNYDPLAAVKAQYDPANLFRVNQDIAPT